MQLLNASTQGLHKVQPAPKIGRPAAFSAFAAPPPASHLVLAQRCSTRVNAKLGDVSLFGDSSSMGSFGGPIAEEAKATKPKLDEVPLASTVGMDYSALRDALQEGDFRKADDETRALLIKLAGEGAVKRDWVYWSEVQAISNTDLQTLDALWKIASNGKFGYSVQKELWLQNQKRWPKFFKQIDWVQGEDNNYRKWPAEFTYSMNAVKGHLPLTNALRGTQLFVALLNHPAFEKAAAGPGSGKKTLDDMAREQGAKTSKLF